MRLSCLIVLELVVLTTALACAPPHSVNRLPSVFDSDGGAVQPNLKNAPDGVRCTGNLQCRSGECVDGVCCQSACGTACMACDQPGSEGRCVPVSDGQDPDDECGEEPAATCGRDGVCDGRGACRRYSMGTQCAPGSCQEATERAASTCDGNGACQPGAAKSCAPAVCIADSCGAPCAVHTDCQTGFFCDAGTCRTRREQGKNCDMNEQCGTGNCVDKVCCATTCTDKCYACNVSGSVGSCTAVPNQQDPRQECPVQGIITCGNAGGCNGRGACRLHVPGTTCSIGTTCTGSTLVAPSACDGMGRCVPGARSDCAPYVCDGPVCWSVCGTNAQCRAPATCRVGGRCQ